MTGTPLGPSLLAGVLGAMIGSFLNVCIFRIPRRVSIVFPPSACPACQARIAPYDNVPVLGWLLLRGRCRRCRAAISPRYPVVEALTALLFVFLLHRYGVHWALLPALYFASAMLVVTLIDYDARIIPDAITLSGIPLGLLASFLTEVTFVNAMAGAAVGFLILAGIGWVYHRITGIEGMGGGDVKFAAMLGAFLGVSGLVLTLFLASLGGTVIGLTLMAARRGGRRTALPFGTFLAPAALLVYLWGDRVIAWYLGRLTG